MQKQQYLADLMIGKDNNLNLLRMVAAAAVLVTHSFALVTGSGASEPLRTDYGCTLGSIAVDIFFMVSGLLVTNSLLQRRSLVDFARARFLRIWPGLIAVTVLSVLVIGPVFTSLATSRYFSTWQTWRYFIKNILLVRGVEFSLPGVFATNPWPDAVNGSIWTLQSEITVYAMLLLAWLIAALLRTDWLFKTLIVTAFAVFFGTHLLELRETTLEQTSTRLYGFFFLGSIICLFKHVVPMRHSIFLACFSLVLASMLWRADIFPYIYSLTLPYLILYLAYVPTGVVRGYNRLGDYSYGTYLYAYPVQQMLIASVAGLTVPTMMLSSFAVTVTLAVASWHLIERRAIHMGKPRKPMAA